MSISKGFEKFKFKTQLILGLFLVDDAGEILSLDQDTFEPPPSNFSVISRELVMGVHKLSDRLLLILDPQLINQRTEKTKNQLLLA